MFGVVQTEAIATIGLLRLQKVAERVTQAMSTQPETCPACKRPIDYWRVRCRCGLFVGFPNHRAVSAERDELDRRYKDAKAGCQAMGLEHLLTELEQLAEQSRPVISMSFEACDDILRSGKYHNYSRRVDSGERTLADATNHSDRETVGARLFAGYHQHIHYAALSPDGRGLLSYGPIAVRWEVTPDYLGKRATLLEENSFIFYDRHALGELRATVPAGYQAIWDDRSKLAACKGAHRLTVATGVSALASVLFHPGKSRIEDDFVEVMIFADEGLDTLDVDRVTLSRSPRSEEESHRRELVRQACAGRGIGFVE